MTRLPAIGRVADTEEIDLDPIEVPVIGYTLDKTEVEEVFKFRPVQPAGATINILLATGAGGAIPIAEVMQFLQDCLLAEERERWSDFLNDPGIMIEQSVLGILYRELMEVYANRPLLRWSDSGGGGKPAGQTSPAARVARGSRSKPKASGKP